MEKQKVFEIFKSALVKSHLNNDPSLTEDQLSQIKEKVESTVTLQSPLSSLNLDSMTMTWIVVRLEEELDVDASGISFFDIYDVDNLINEVLELK